MSYDYENIYSLLHMITVLEVLHDVIIVIFPFFTNQKQSQLHNSQSRAGVQRRLGLLQRAEVSEKSESENSSIVGPCNMNNMKSWKNLGPPNLPIFMENLSCFIMFYLSQHSQNCTTVPGRGSHVPAHHNRLISAWVP